MNDDTSTVQVMKYWDFKLDVTTEPDQNGCMWVTLRRFISAAEADYLRRGCGGVQRWDMAEDCVRRLRDACNQFLTTCEQLRGETGGREDTDAVPLGRSA